MSRKGIWAKLNGTPRFTLPPEKVAVVLAALCITLQTAPLHGQTNVGSIVGTVTDTSGAVMVGARISLLNPATGDRMTTITNNVGEYVFPMVRPATYNVSADSNGFKTLLRSNVILQVAETLRINFTLEPGAVTQTVEVKGASPLLQPETSSLGTVIAGQTIDTLPLNGRNVYDLVALTPGVAPTDTFGSGGIPVGGFFQGDGLNDISINGGRNLTNGFMLDDVTNNLMGYGGIGAVPILDSVQEFNVLTNSFSAKYGRTGGGIVTAVSKGGTNTFHGDVYEFLRNRALNSNDFFSNRNGSNLPQFQQNQFGATAGGPIRRDRTFFFGAYEGFRQTVGGQTLTTVPTDLERNGDFSQTFAQDGKLQTIYNPFTTHIDPTTGYHVRDPFPSNVIPSSLFDPVAVNLLKFYPEPNVPGDPVTHANNFFKQVANHTTIDRFQGRIDQNFSDRQRFFGRFYYDRERVATGNVFGNVADFYSSASFFNGHAHTVGLALSYTNTLNPTTILNVRYGLIRSPLNSGPLSVGFDPTSLGLPASLVDQFEAKVFPLFNIVGFSPIGAQYFSLINNSATTNSLAANLSKVIGRHSIEVGVDLRLIQGSTFQPGWPSGQFDFDPGFTTGPDANSPNPDNGNGIASLLLGTISNGGNFASYDPHWFFTNRYYSAYVQDDIKVNSKLTLNLGLRYDYESPLLDRHNQLSWVDFKSQIPITVPQVSVPNFGQLPKEPFIGGGAQFPGARGNPRGGWLPNRLGFGPRVGLAYSISPKTVIRSAYGITYPGTTSDNSGNFPTIQGFNPITTTTLAPDGFTPLQRPDGSFLLRNPYPSGLIKPPSSSLGLLTSLGNNDQGLEYRQKYAYFQQWNFGIQRQLPGDMLVEVAYVGSHGVHLADFAGRNWNALPDQYLALGNSLSNQYTNPFLGVVPANSTLGGQPTISLQQLLLPYPEFTGVIEGPVYQTSSNYDAFQLKGQKRMSHGLSFLAAYTVAKMLTYASGTSGAHLGGTSGHQDPYNIRLDYALDSTDRSQFFVFSPVYELPLGPGKAIGSGISNPVMSHLIGGWELSSILSLATGFPISTNCVVCTFPASRPNLVGDPKAGIHGSNESRLNEWFNVDAFAQNIPFHYGTAPRVLGSLRGPGTANTDLSLIKNTRFTERYNVEFRAEAFNLLNRPQFCNPDVAFGDTTFGEITRQCNSPREIQFGLKFYW